MKIDNNALNLNPQPPAAQAAQSAQASQASGKTRHGHLDSNDGSGDRVQLSGLMSHLALQAGSDDAKVAELQAAYETGTYDVSPRQIAASMLNYITEARPFGSERSQQSEAGEGAGLTI
jgi:flagellar biosynthesis anti-sigma factor FlgM